MDILELVSDVTKESKSFANHPAKELELEERLLYLNGLALVMNVDNEIDDEEKEYLRILLKSFEMSEDLLNDFVRFAGAPDKDTVQAFFKTFRRRDMAKLFIFDALMMTRRDEKIGERETALIDKLCQELEIPKGAYAEIYDLFCHIKNRDWKETKSFFSLSPINVEYFQHLLDYHEVSLADVLRDKAAALQEELGFKWVEAKYDGDSFEEIEASAVEAKAEGRESHMGMFGLSRNVFKQAGGLENQIRYNPFGWSGNVSKKSGGKSKARKYLIAGPVTYAQFIRFLQFAADNREIRVLDRKVMNNKGEFLMDLDMAKISYDQENRKFSCKGTLNNKPVSGFTPLGVTAFAESVGCSIGYGKKYSFFVDEVCLPMGGSKKTLENELIYTYKETYYLSPGNWTRLNFDRTNILIRTIPLENAVFRVMKSKDV